eukprot:TRINITY_DN8889_c0_g1_i1.p1 TRINITY_DN8889_c0_g1~~TRINITY_DN8889_c0_g1_i1.p1  ORF type:complete len:127 (-),score=25.44 TRINITY_DN8889_c0_g1_i1:77-457(-)
MKTALFIVCHVLALALAFPDLTSPAERTKRDVTCASMGHNSCRWSCKVRGWASGECVWNMTTAAYNCECDKEKRGVRCNIGGPNTCDYTCRMLGHTSGECDEEFRCSCSGDNNRWGSLLANIGNRL